jgi:hypothetical protein
MWFLYYLLATLHHYAVSYLNIELLYSTTSDYDYIEPNSSWCLLFTYTIKFQDNALQDEL